MILPDINLLLYAYNRHSEHYETSSQWWTQCLNHDEQIALPYEIVFGFIRIATNPRLGNACVGLKEAKKTVDTWLDCPHARLILPDPNHYVRVLSLMEQTRSKGAILSDAILASYAICNGATLYSNDTDFARFPKLVWKNPLLDDA